MSNVGGKISLNNIKQLAIVWFDCFGDLHVYGPFSSLSGAVEYLHASEMFKENTCDDEKEEATVEYFEKADDDSFHGQHDSWTITEFISTEK